jgi:hypothetical protein
MKFYKYFYLISAILAIDYDDINKPVNLALLNVHVVQPNRETSETKKLRAEKRIERDRIRDIEESEEIEKQQFLKILEERNNVIKTLSDIAEQSTHLIQEIVKNSELKLNYENYKILNNLPKTVIPSITKVDSLGLPVNQK